MGGKIEFRGQKLTNLKKKILLGKKQAGAELKKKKGIFGQKMVEKFSSGAIVDQLKKKGFG